MRSITTLTLTLALALTACTEDKNEPETTAATMTASATDGTGGTGTGTDGTGTTADATTTPTTSGASDSASTTEPATSTTDPGTSTTDPGTSTTDPGTSSTTTGGTTGGGDESPYGNCATDDDCEMGAFCINSALTGGQVKGSFCSPACSGPGKLCPDPAAGVAASEGAQCLFGADAMNPTNCAVVCTVGTDECGPGSDCEDIGIAPQMGVTFGICTFPA